MCITRLWISLPIRPASSARIVSIAAFEAVVKSAEAGVLVAIIVNKYKGLWESPLWRTLNVLDGDAF